MTRLANISAYLDRGFQYLTVQIRGNRYVDPFNGSSMGTEKARFLRVFPSMFLAGRSAEADGEWSGEFGTSNSPDVLTLDSFESRFEKIQPWWTRIGKGTRPPWLEFILTHSGWRINTYLP